MELTHRFTVPGTVDDTWARFQDIGALAECFPGAKVTSVEGDTFEGTVKVKLGPIALVYSGSGTFTEKDETAHRMVVEAKGKDKRGNGTAGATATLSMAEESEGTTAVEVATDLSITGKPAQFGRGVIQDVSDKLLGQFTACLEERSQAPAEPEPAPEAAAEETPPPSTPAPAAADEAPRQAGGTSAAPPAPAASAGPAGGEDDALDLGAAVVPVLVKSYAKQAAIGAAVLLVLGLLLRRRRRRKR